DAGNTDATPASATWTVDPTLPALSIEQPDDGARTADSTPTFSGHAGTAAGDSSTVTVKIYRPVPGAPDVLVQTRTTVRSSLEGPPDDTLTNDTTPLFSGHASTVVGDSGTVDVEIYRPVAGGPDELVQTLSTVRSSIDGTWSVAASPGLADGTYLAYATQDNG